MKKIYQLTRSSVAIVAAVLCMFAFANKGIAQPMCGAGFQYTVSPGGVVTFYDSSYVAGGTLTSSAWSFGDGTTGTGSQVVHTYIGNGPYTVCYYITTSNGCSDSTCMTVMLSPCTLAASLAYDSVQNILTVIASGGTPPYMYSWSNGAIGVSIGNVVSGTYCVNVVDANGCSQYVCYTVGSTGGGCSAYFTYGSNGVNNTYNFYSSISGSYSSLLWNFGDGTTSTLANPTHHYTNPGTYGPCLTVYTTGGNVCSTYCDTLVVANSTGNSVLCGNLFGDLNANGILDSNETGIFGQNIYVYGNGFQFSATTDSSGHYSFNVPAGTYYINYCTQFPYSLTVPIDTVGCGFYTVTIGANDTICGFDYGVVANSAYITGTVFIDANSNGVLDGNEYGIPYQAVQVGSTWTYTNSNGYYSCYKPTGTYVVTYTPTGSYAPYSLTTASTITVNASTAGNTYGGNNFGLNIPPGTVNLSVNLNPHTTVTPGFPAWYDIQVCNVGVMPVASTLTMIYDAGLTLSYASPAPASNNTTTHTLTWNLAALAPGNCNYLWVDFDAATSLVLGTNTVETAIVTPVTGSDIDMTNNIDTVHQTVVGSWDPNNKLAVRTNFTDPAYQVVSSVNPDQTMEYTINFQNEGTAPAQNIVVVDELSSDVDLTSFKLTGTSHNASVSRVGNKVTYKFVNINLPDATTNEPMSHGFVSYSIKANNGLAAGHQISDFANIYFDFNSPVLTNNAVVTLIMPNGINDVKGGSTTLNSYPNPVTNISTLQFDLKSKANVRVDVIDVTGRVVLPLINSDLNSGNQKVSMDASQLSNGIYTISLTVDGKTSYTKVAVSH